MDVQELLRSKTVTLEEAVAKIESNDYIYTYGAAGEPQTFLSNLASLKDRVRDVKIVNFLNSLPYDYYSDESYEGVIENESCFFGRFCKDGQIKGTNTYIPTHLRHSYTNLAYYRSIREDVRKIFVISVTPMDKHGYFSSSTVGMAVRDMVKWADIVILEVNENLPRTFGDTNIHISEADYVFQGNNKVIYLPSRDPDETDMAIGANIAELIEDGSTLQLGIGGIPNAVAKSLGGKKDLGVHTEMLNDGLVQLYKEGVVTNRCKTIYEDKMVTTFTLGSKETYDFLDDNPGVLHINTAVANNPDVIAKNYKMVSVNTTLQIDLAGQCASEAVGTIQISGIGGQSETVVGAKASPGGKSIMALHSTAMVKNRNGEKERRSTIVSVHPAGTMISLLRSDTDYVVTEYGVASLRGASLYDRAEQLIGIAHPDFREELRQEARKYHLI